MSKLFAYQDIVQFALYEEFDSQFAPEVLEAGFGGIMSHGLVGACEIAFSVNLMVFSSVVVCG